MKVIKKKDLLKSLKNIEGKDEEQLKELKDQGEKQLQILARKTDKEVDFKNVLLRGTLDYSKSKKVYNEIKEQDEKINYTKLVCIGSGKHQYNFTIALDLKSLAESIYNSNFSLEVVKVKQRNMDDVITRLEDYNPKKEKYKTQKTSTFLNAREFYKGRKMIVIAFENVIPLPKQY